LNYRTVARAIADLGFSGFISHEYTPSPGHDPIAELKKAIEICTV
jgi:hydroxypyruvate isomerase